MKDTDGSLEYDDNYKIKWRKLNSMNMEREEHFSILVGKELHVFGGALNGEDQIEIFDGRTWKLGPLLPIELSTYNAQAVVDCCNRIIITTKQGIVIYDVKNEKVVSFEEQSQKWLSLTSAFQLKHFQSHLRLHCSQTQYQQLLHLLFHLNGVR